GRLSFERNGLPTATFGPHQGRSTMMDLVMEAGAIALPAHWPSGGVAYFDKEWTGASSRKVPTLVVHDGAVYWHATHLPVPDGQSADTVALACVLTVALEAVAALGSVD